MATGYCIRKRRAGHQGGCLVRPVSCLWPQAHSLQERFLSCRDAGPHCGGGVHIPGHTLRCTGSIHFPYFLEVKSNVTGSSLFASPGERPVSVVVDTQCLHAIIMPRFQGWATEQLGTWVTEASFRAELLPGYLDPLERACSGSATLPPP